MSVEDKAGDLIGFIGDDRFIDKGGEGQIGEGHLGGDALDGATRGNAGEFVASTRRCRFSEQVLEIKEGIGDAVDGVAQSHKFLRGAMGCWVQSINATVALMRAIAQLWSMTGNGELSVNWQYQSNALIDCEVDVLSTIRTLRPGYPKHPVCR